MRPATGAKIGRGWPNSSFASHHDGAVASAACANHRQFVRSRSATLRGRPRSAASSSSASLRSRTRAAPCSRSCVVTRCATSTDPMACARFASTPHAIDRCRDRLDASASAPGPRRDRARSARAASFARVIVDPEVAGALRAGQGVVALESTLIAPGLPAPDNLRVAREAEAAVRASGAVPATIAVVGGEVRIGLDDAALEAIALGEGVIKAGVRDLAPAVARGATAATTVASTAHLAARAGIAVFATGGLGGVHRGARETWDESADLTTLSQTGIVLVCAGVKSILDVAATLERLETLNVTLAGWRTGAFPGFYLRDSGHPVGWRVESAEEVAAMVRARGALGLGDRAIVIANPLPEDEQLDPALHDRVLRESLKAAAAAGIAGRDVTPFLLDRFHRETAGASLRTNVRLVLRNAELAGRIAVAVAAGGGPGPAGGRASAAGAPRSPAAPARP